MSRPPPWAGQTSRGEDDRCEVIIYGNTGPTLMPGMLGHSHNSILPSIDLLFGNHTDHTVVYKTHRFVQYAVQEGYQKGAYKRLEAFSHTQRQSEERTKGGLASDLRV